MSALSILLLVLPFPLAFILHDAEEVVFINGWMLRHRSVLVQRFPKMASPLDRLSGLGARGFAIAAAEELLIILLATVYVLVQGPYAREIWAALFIAFSIHLLVHIVQAVIVRGYVPGLATSILLLPYAFYGIYSIWLAMSWLQIILLGLGGIALMLVNLRFAHWLGGLARRRQA
ncbi:MAG: HXXEE domain-containing protein [Candidatus Cryptobacteroides sp.]